MQYYAQIGSDYYRFISVKENYSLSNKMNNFIKASIVIKPENHKPISTKEYTIHPDKIAVKTIFPTGTKLIGDFRGEETGREYKTLYNFGYNGLKESLVKLLESNVNNGFAIFDKSPFSELRKQHKIIQFPEDPFRPYWMSLYFTTFNAQKTNETFEKEKLDEIIHVRLKKGAIVILLKYLIPEWERLCIEPEDKLQGWVHPVFSMSKQYQWTNT